MIKIQANENAKRRLRLSKELIMKTSNSHIYEYSVFKGILPSMRYDGKSDFSQWQTTARNKLSELLGLPLGECDGEVNIEYKKDFSSVP